MPDSPIERMRARSAAVRQGSRSRPESDEDLILDQPEPGDAMRLQLEDPPAVSAPPRTRPAAPAANSVQQVTPPESLWGNREEDETEEGYEEPAEAQPVAAPPLGVGSEHEGAYDTIPRAPAPPEPTADVEDPFREDEAVWPEDDEDDMLEDHGEPPTGGLTGLAGALRARREPQDGEFREDTSRRVKLIVSGLLLTAILGGTGIVAALRAAAPAKHAQTSTTPSHTNPGTPARRRASRPAPAFGPKATQVCERELAGLAHQAPRLYAQTLDRTASRLAELATGPRQSQVAVALANAMRRRAAASSNPATLRGTITEQASAADHAEAPACAAPSALPTQTTRQKPKAAAHHPASVPARHRRHRVPASTLAPVPHATPGRSPEPPATPAPAAKPIPPSPRPVTPARSTPPRSSTPPCTPGELGC